MKVVKFGGSSLASAKQLNKVFNIIKEDSSRKIVVVSAPGKRNPEDEKVTDMLIEYANAFLAKKDVTKIQTKIIDRYACMIHELGVDKNILEDVTNSILSLTHMPLNNKERVMDAFKASGENNNAKVVANYFSNSGIPASYVNPKEAGIIVSDEPGNAQLLPCSYDKLYQLRDREEVLVIPGFFGYTETDEICTFSRGGSDITGSIVAAGVQADLYENFTDVNAIFTAHPGIIKEPVKIEELTFREMRELSYAGFGVFHDEALMPAFHAGIKVVIKNTNNPSAPGTKILPAREISKMPVVGISADSGFSSIYISKYLMNRELGFGRKLLTILEEENINYEHMPSGIDDISIIIRENQMPLEKEEIVIEKIVKNLNPDVVRVTHDLSMLAIVGEGMKSNVGVAAKSTGALANHNINLEMINQGSSEVSILFAINRCDENKAIKALYHAFF